MSFRLYDSSGRLAAESAGSEAYPAGLTIRAGDGELLLCVPVDPGAPILYCLYNHHGDLLTCSDGTHTMIRSLLRMVAGRC